MLLELGLAVVHEYSALQSPHSRDLFDAEKRGKEAKKGVWSIQRPTAEEDVNQKEDENTNSVEEEGSSEIEVVISDISGSGQFYFQQVGDGTRKLEQLMADFGAFYTSSQPPPTFSPNTNDYVAAQYSIDNSWYRGRIKKVNPDKTYTVLYVDYGNSETVPVGKLRPLDGKFSVTFLAPQAREGVLAYITVPSLDEEYGMDAYERIRELTEGKMLKGRLVLNKKQPQSTSTPLPLILVLGEDKSRTTVNQILVSEGLAVVEKSVARRYNTSSVANSNDKKPLNGDANGNHAAHATIQQSVQTLLQGQEQARASRVSASPLLV